MVTQKLGELNGKWTILFKALIVAVPIVVLHAGWMSSELVASGKILAGIEASRFTAEDGLAVWQEIAAIRETMASLPGDRFRDKVDELARNQQKMLQDLAALKVVARIPE